MSEIINKNNNNNNEEETEVMPSVSGLEAYRIKKAEKKQKQIEKGKNLSKLRKEKQANGQKTKPISKSARAGVIFPVTRIVKKLKSIVPQKKNRVNASVYIAAVLEYLCAEVLELAGNCATAMKKLRITPRHILLATKEDPELDLLLKNVLLCNSGVVPNVHPNLLLPLKSDWPKGPRANKHAIKSTIAYNDEMEELQENIAQDTNNNEMEELQENVAQDTNNNEMEELQENVAHETSIIENSNLHNLSGQLEKSESESQSNRTVITQKQHEEVSQSFNKVDDHQQENEISQYSFYEACTSSKEIEIKSPNKRTRSVSSDSNLESSPIKKFKFVKETPTKISVSENDKKTELNHMEENDCENIFSNKNEINKLSELPKRPSPLENEINSTSSSANSQSTLIIDETQSMSPVHETKVEKKRLESLASVSNTPITTRSNKKIQSELDKAKKSFEKSMKIIQDLISEKNDDNSSETSLETGQDYINNQKENIVSITEKKTDEGTTAIVRTYLSDITNKINH